MEELREIYMRRQEEEEHQISLQDKAASCFKGNWVKPEADVYRCKTLSPQIIRGSPPNNLLLKSRVLP